ncbi:coiled-coil domain-containing protein 103-like [Schistocerca americana]|uniref:coiled-coil domain-containing protein 103-like n=1 Tax=Schistocerca americana TaxID=7009 RepID=UPI001F4F7F88|nr:coiled-coil domain-containing protein 103-like [Schistocerca americana]
MADICKKEINVKELEAELQKKIDDDARYWRENDAKFRAIDQKVATYDEFRDMVKAAHLQPVKKREVQYNPDKARKRVWNTVAPKQKEISQENYCQHELYRLGKSSGTIVPTTLPQFCQEWRRLPKIEHLSFLKTVGSLSLAKVLQSELPAVEFGEIIMALSEYSTEDAPFVVSLLKVFASAKRFRLAVQFLSDEQQKSCEALFHKLLSESASHLGINMQTLEDLRKLYVMEGV